MNADKIAEVIRAAKTVADLEHVAGLAQARREAIKARIHAIHSVPQGSHIPVPAERRMAALQGAAALQKLNDEEESLRVEIVTLDHLEAIASDTRNSLLASELRKSIPIAKRKFADAMRTAIGTANTLASAIDDLNRTVIALGEYQRADMDFPLSDSELVSLIELRDRVATFPIVTVLTPVNEEALPRAHAKYFMREFQAGAVVLVTRKPGQIEDAA